MTDWKKWIGLPHKPGSDPRKGEGACCVFIAKILLEENGYAFPLPPDEILSLSDKGFDSSITELFYDNTEPIDSPEPWSVCLIKNGSAGLGIGIVVASEDNKKLYLLLPHHRKGVQAIPLTLIRSLNYYRAKR